MATSPSITGSAPTAWRPPPDDVAASPRRQLAGVGGFASSGPGSGLSQDHGCLVGLRVRPDLEDVEVPAELFPGPVRAVKRVRCVPDRVTHHRDLVLQDLGDIRLGDPTRSFHLLEVLQCVLVVDGRDYQAALDGDAVELHKP